MTIFFRQIEAAVWVEDSPAWLDPTDAVGNQVSNLAARMSDNTVAFYGLPSAAPTNLRRLGAAMTAGRDRVQDVEYFLFEEDLLHRASVVSVRSSGATGDPEVDGWHHDVVKVTGRGLTKLACELRSCRVERLMKEDVQAELVRAIGEEKRFARPAKIEQYLKKKSLLP